MSDKKYTPGPWDVGFGNGLYGDVISWSCILDGHKECKQLPVYHGKEAVTVIYYSRDDETNLANARLISCAPELLEALEELVNHLKDGCYCGEVFPDGHPMLTAIDVIFKAKGEQQ